MDKKELAKFYGKILILILFDISIIWASVEILLKYNETIIKMPKFPKPNYLIVDLTIILAFAFSMNFLLGFLIKDKKKESIEDSLYNTYLLQLIEDNEDDEKKKDVIEKMLKNNNEIEEYFKISKKQEKFSYGVSMACAIVGAIMLFSSIAAIFFNRGIEITVVTIISGAITELVSGIVLWIHNKSAMQLNFYYNSLHENEKFLSAINMTDRIEDKDKKEQMYEEIIKAQIRVKEENKENENKG